MKNIKMLTLSAIAGALSFWAVPQSLLAEAAAVSKPEAAIGMGTVAPGQAKSNQFWWPDQLDLSPLRDQDARSNPAGEGFSYASEFSKLDLKEVKKDIDSVLTDSQDWWPR